MILFVEDPTVFDDEAAFPSLVGTLDAVSTGRHRLRLSPTLDIANTRFHARAFGTLQGVLDAADFERQELLLRTPYAEMAEDPEEAAPSRPTTIHAEITTRPEDSPARFPLSPSRANGWCHTPLKLVLENHNDLALVRAAVYAHADGDDEAADAAGRIDEALDEAQRWLTTEPPGGSSEVRRRIERAAPDERLFVLADSDRVTWPAPTGDRTYPTHEQLEATWPTSHSEARAIHAVCLEREVGVHIWNRREADNYLPEDLIDRATRAGDRRLREQRAAFKRIYRRAPAGERYTLDFEAAFQGAPSGAKSWLTERLQEFGRGDGVADPDAACEFGRLLRAIARWL